ncbi:hypothetical protein [Streptomyces thermoalcalitolerans]|uniref:DNA primase/polymerase bifunctional N-terminal domain-containing protein n=1 Tax=Streptomyces thermoalcalitolerans TaxID=65605 RepID=A0ABP3YTD6_9ACTN
MISDGSQQALRPVECESQPGVLVHPAADRRLAVGHWLLAACPDEHRGYARAEWEQQGVALLPLGALFSAVRIPARLVHAVAGRTRPEHVDEFLGQTLEGPVICSPRHQRYYALVPPSMPVSWHRAMDDWRTQDVDCLGRGTYLGVPRPDAVEPRPLDPYWSVPMPSLGILCPPLAVARLIAAGRHRLMGEDDVEP